MSGRDIADRQTLGLGRGRSAASFTRPASESAVDGNSFGIGDASCVTAHANSISRLASGQRRSVYRSLLRMQRQYGNQFVGRVLQRAGSADGVNADTDAIERSIEHARGSGSGMDHATRGQMETAFGAKFTGVRIHTDSRADEMSRGLSARAFTTGHDVFFRQGEYNPGSSSGRELLAHELTHVVQQNDEVRCKMTVSDPGDAHELEAEQMARAVVQQEGSVAGGQVAARQEEDDKAVATMRSSAVVQRQPEAMSPIDEDEKKKALHAKRDGGVVSRDKDQPPD